MAKAEALAQLKDIHLPESIGWWPLAPGWYVLMIIALFLMLGIAYLDHKRRLNAKPKNQALALLHIYIQQYEKENNAQIISARISELLRRVALVYFPRNKVASLHGQDWVDFLNQTSQGINFNSVQSMLLDSPFKTEERQNMKPLITRSEQWIKQRRVPCSN